MRLAIAFVVVCGAMLSVDAACSLGSCVLGTQTTGTAGCTTYQTYITCLTNAQTSCTSSTVDVAMKETIKAAITANTALRTALNCNAASGLTASVVTFVLSAVAVFLKL